MRTPGSACTISRRSSSSSRRARRRCSTSTRTGSCSASPILIMIAGAADRRVVVLEPLQTRRPAGMKPKKTIRDLTDAELRGKRALVRVDFNVPIEGDRVTDDTRIRAALPTIEALARARRARRAPVAPRPSEGQARSKFSLEPVAKHLQTLLDGKGRLRRDHRQRRSAPRHARREARHRAPPREHALPGRRGEERGAPLARARGAGRSVRERRVRLRAPRARVHRRRRALSQARRRRAV